MRPSIPALTIRQPWASLLMAGVKPWEMRSWTTRYRGPILIHAGLGQDPVPELLRESIAAPLPRGALIGIGVLRDVHRAEDLRAGASAIVRACCGDLRAGLFAWEIVDLQPLRPIPCRGSLGLWRTDVTARFIDPHIRRTPHGAP